MSDGAAPGDPGSSGHWMERQMALLYDLVERYTQVRGLTSAATTADEAADADEQGRNARAALKAVLEQTLREIADRDGVTGCMVSAEGLVLAHAGALPDFDALAAVSHECFLAASRGGRTMALGDIDQLVIVGGEHKLALFAIGAMVLGVVCPRDTVLGEALR